MPVGEHRHKYFWKFSKIYKNRLISGFAQLIFTSSKLKTETLEKEVKYVQSKQ